MKRTPEELKELLRACGREMAADWFHVAFETENKEVAQNQCQTLHYAALHILATNAYNLIKQDGRSREFAVTLISKEFSKELDFLLSIPPEAMEFSKFGDGNEPEPFQ